jgi:outer membrane protein assembly factor BamA
MEEDTLVSIPLGVVDTVIVSGNEKTEAYVILDEMSLRKGSTVTAEAMEFDRNRIYSLGLFTSVEINTDTLEGERFLFVGVKERWYLMPLVVFGFLDGDPKKPYYGGGLAHNNFLGKNQKVYGVLVFGHNPRLELGFNDPLLDRDHQVFFSGNLSFSRIRNKSAIESAVTGDFDEDHYDINVTVGKRLNLFETVGINAGFNIIEVSSFRPGRTASPTGKDLFIYASMRYTNDTRDLREYPTKGHFLSGYVMKNGFGEAKMNLTRFGADVRAYVPLPLDFTLAGRAHGSLVSGGFVPTYARAYFGYGERIRGYFKEVFEGENLLGSSLELRWPLLKARTFTFTAISLPQEFSVWRFGVSLALFADAGATWFRGQHLALDSFVSGYGGGIHFLLPYSVVIRTEYAWNGEGRGQFILNLRSSF